MRLSDQVAALPVKALMAASAVYETSYNNNYLQLLFGFWKKYIVNVRNVLQ